jgi:hypothetical protein
MPAAGAPNVGPVHIATIAGSETITPASNDLVTVIDVSDSNRLKTSTVSDISSGAADAKVAVDAAATADFLGAASNDGAIRVDSSLDYADGGNFVTLSLDSTLKTNYDAASTHVSSNGSDHSFIDQSVATTADPIFIGSRNTTQALSDGANIAVNFNSGYDATVTVAGNRTMDAPTNIDSGGSGVFTITCDGTARTLTWASAYRLNGSASPSTAFAASSINKVYWHSADGTNVDIDVIYGV